MSRSYKKTWGYTESQTSYNHKKDKRFASKKVRRVWDIPNGSKYKRLYCSYDICDYKFLLFTKKEVKEWLESPYYIDKEYKLYIK